MGPSKTHAFQCFLTKKRIPLQSGDAHVHQPSVFTRIYTISRAVASNQSVFTVNYACQKTPVLSLFVDVLKHSYFLRISLNSGLVDAKIINNHTFLQWIMDVSEPSQKCIKKQRLFNRRNQVFSNIWHSNATTCCKYAGSVSTVFIFSILLMTFDRKITFRCRVVAAMSPNISFYNAFDQYDWGGDLWSCAGEIFGWTQWVGPMAKTTHQASQLRVKTDVPGTGPSQKHVVQWLSHTSLL